MAIKLINNEGEEKILPIFVSMPEIDTPKQVPHIERSSGDGAARAGRERLESRSFALEGSVYEGKKEDTRQAYDELIRFLQFTPIKVFQQADDDRFIYAYVQDFDQNWLDAREELELEIDMIALDPYFYSEEKVVSERITLNEANGYSYQLEVENEGTIEAKPCLMLELEVVAGLSDSSLVDDTYQLDDTYEIDDNASITEFISFLYGIDIEQMGDEVGQFSVENIETSSIVEFELSPDDKIEINSEDIQVSINDQNSLNVVNDNFLLYSFLLSPGSNTIEISADNDFVFDFEIRYSSKYL